MKKLTVSSLSPLVTWYLRQCVCSFPASAFIVKVPAARLSWACLESLHFQDGGLVPDTSQPGGAH